MTTRPLTIATLLMVSAALAAHPALAASPGVAAYGGPGLNPATPGVPMPAPQLDPDSTTRARILAARLSAYATVSRSADGTTTLIPASDELRALIEADFEDGLPPPAI